MDERAWDFLLSAPGHTQEVVFKDFRPRRLDDADYSAFPLFWRFCDRACAPQAAEHAAHANMFSLGAQRSCGGGAFAAALVAGRDRVAAALAEPRKGGWVEVLTPELRVVETLDVAAADLAICGDVLIAGCADGSVQLWDLRAKGKQRQLFSAWEPVQSVSVTDGVCALAAGVSTTLVDLSGVSCVRFHPDRPSHLVTGGDDGLMCVLDTTRRPTEEESLHLAMNSEESVERLAFAAEGDVLCSVSSSNVLQLWSLKDPKAGARCGRLEALRSDPRLKVGESDGHLIDVLSDQSRGYVLAGNTKGRLFLYHLNLEGAEFLEASEGGHSALVRASASVGSAFVTGGEDGRLCLWQPKPGEAPQVRVGGLRLEGPGANTEPPPTVRQPTHGQRKKASERMGYGLGVTAFVRSMTRRVAEQGPSQAKLDMFREKFPMDDRAFQYLCNSNLEMQQEALQNFAPKHLDEADFSRQLTAFLNRSRPLSRGLEPTMTESRRRVDWRRVPDIRDLPPERGGFQSTGGDFGRSTHRDLGVGRGYDRDQRDFRDRSRDYGRDQGRGHGKGRGHGEGRDSRDRRDGRAFAGSDAGRKGGGRLRAFRAQYPMDDRAFDYLSEADAEVQEAVFSDFQPKRRHLDDDYSASVTTYVKAVKAKARSAVPHATRAGNEMPEALLTWHEAEPAQGRASTRAVAASRLEGACEVFDPDGDRQQGMKKFVLRKEVEYLVVRAGITVARLRKLERLAWSSEWQHGADSAAKAENWLNEVDGQGMFCKAPDASVQELAAADALRRYLHRESRTAVPAPLLAELERGGAVRLAHFAKAYAALRVRDPPVLQALQRRSAELQLSWNIQGRSLAELLDSLGKLAGHGEAGGSRREPQGREEREAWIDLGWRGLSQHVRTHFLQSASQMRLIDLAVGLGGLARLEASPEVLTGVQHVVITALGQDEPLDPRHVATLVASYSAFARLGFRDDAVLDAAGAALDRWFAKPGE
ncbi:unnamed protein product [Effrenium voratum]|nr:unnamed protein product [Effrenium voratum]